MGSAVVAIGAAQQLQRQRGVLEAAGGVEPRREAKADGAGVDAVGLDPGDLHQGGQAGARRAAQAPQADARQHAVLVDERHDVGDGADGDHIAERPQGQRHLDARLRGLFEQRVRKLEGDADAGELRARVAGQLGSDDHAVRRRALHLVVVGDDDVHAELAGARHLGARVDAAVDRDEQLDAAGGELLHGGRRDPVPFGEPVRQMPAHVGAELLEDAHQQERRGDAVGVVVAVDGDGLAALQRLVEATARVGHARHEVRVVDAGSPGAERPAPRRRR